LTHARSGNRTRHPQRLPAAERREALLEAALAVFAQGSYSGATTAEIARAAGISEPILYRHFASKRDLYLAVIEHMWTRLRAAWEAAIAKAEPEELPGILFATVRALKKRGWVPSLLWVQALTEAGEDEHIARFMRKHLREVHDFVAATLRHAQERGAVSAERDPDAEAWVFVAGALLFSTASRLGGVLTEDDFAAIARERERWLTGVK
jgi:AcrR family transcriptional regulator